MATALVAAPLRALNNPFQFSEHEVRTATDERGDAWFCAKDVFEALDIAWSQRTGSLKNYPENWIRALYLRGQSGSGEVIFLAEPGVYKAIFSSRSQEALRFTRWVCEEVLPAIRRQGPRSLKSDLCRAFSRLPAGCLWSLPCDVSFQDQWVGGM